MREFYQDLQPHLQVGGVDEGGVPAGEEGDGGRHLADVPDPVGDVELSPHRLPLLSPPGPSSLIILILININILISPPLPHHFWTLKGPKKDLT